MDAGRGLFIVGGVVKSQLDESDRQVVRDHLAALLQVHNLVILIGSGASFHLGSPQTRNLKTDVVNSLITDSGGTVEKSDSELLGVINPGDSGDLEKLLNGLQLATALADQTDHATVTLGEGDSARAFQVEDIDSLRRKIGAALVHACQLPGDPEKIDASYRNDPLSAHRALISRVVRSRRANLPRPRIFTTNYDLVLERALDQLGYPYIDGFSGTVDRRLNLAYYGLDFHRVDTTSQHVLARADGAVYLHKIHGSLNWRAVSERDSITGIESLEVRQVPEGSPIRDERVLIYPTTAKEGDTLAYPYSDLMRLLGDAAQQDDTAIICAGYGFADPHINRILLRSLAMNPDLHVLVVDPVAVLSPDDMSVAVTADGLVGQTLQDAGFTPKSTAIAELARGTDARIAVLTGEAGQFTHFAHIVPDPSIDSGLAAPSEIVRLIDSLQAAMTPRIEPAAPSNGDTVA